MDFDINIHYSENFKVINDQLIYIYIYIFLVLYYIILVLFSCYDTCCLQSKKSVFHTFSAFSMVPIGFIKTFQ